MLNRLTAPKTMALVVAPVVALGAAAFWNAPRTAAPSPAPVQTPASIAPRLYPTPSEALAALKEAMPIDGEFLGDNSHPDSLSGGEARSVIFKDGSVSLFTMPDGQLWRARLTAGSGNRCNGSLAQRPAVARFVYAFVSDGSAAGVKAIDELTGALAQDRLAQVNIGTVRFTAAGGCLDNLTATQEGAI